MLGKSGVAEGEDQGALGAGEDEKKVDCLRIGAGDWGGMKDPVVEAEEGPVGVNIGRGPPGR